jgi:hypothetical protein
MGSLRFVSPLAEAGEELNRRLHPDLSDRVRAHVQQAARSALEAFTLLSEGEPGFDTRTFLVDVLVAAVEGRKVEVSVIVPGHPRG